ncbi:MAG: ABC transporter transmembrane domain-containing protein, partial [Bdellovibrionaceae bacterium]|nr:ABC transporter transmembrane domain-containing protein [Pseudobdellovibrionaceae bacterium]
MASHSFDAAREGIGEGRSHLQTARHLARHLWPADRRDLKMRVLAAMACLATAKLVGVYTPFLYKQAVDVLSPDQQLLAVPVALIVAYGIARVLSQAFGELRDFLFAKVSQHAQRQVGLSTFQHLHALSLAFHLERQTGGLSRVIERGVKGIQFVLSFMLFNILPTILEIALVTGILAWHFGWSFAVVTFVTVALYIIFSIVVTDWRLQYRRRMNQQDADANNKAVDSLLNFETVKYFSNEHHEFARYDVALAGYEREAIRSQT